MFIPTPPWSGIGRRIESATRKALYDFSLLDGVSSLGVAVSGGKDSLTLLLMLHAISGKGFPPFKLTALTVVGEHSCGPAIGNGFLRESCAQLGIPLIQTTVNIAAEQLDCYTCSRRRRKALFEMAKERGCDAIAFGHHRDDNAQTLLLNLLHKGEFAGLLPQITLEAYGATIIRPLIYVAEDDIVVFAKQCGFSRVVCQCPVGQKSNRKTVDGLIDVLETRFPNARANVAHASLLYGSRKAMRHSATKQIFDITQ